MKCKRLSLWMVLMLVLSMLLPAGGMASTRTVRIGYIDYDGFIEETASDGVYAGYGIDLLSEIAQKTGWQYEFVFNTWSSLLDRLASGDIDFICHAQRTAEREERFLYSKYSSGSEGSVLYVRSDDDRYYYDDFDHFGGMRVALMEGSFQTASFAEYAARKGFAFTPVVYASETACFAALDAGQVDAVAMGSLAAKQGYKIACRFGSDPFYFITGQMNQSLLDQVNDALAEIESSDPYYIAKLYETYYGTADAAQSLNLTREEADYIKSVGTVRVGQLRNRYPLSNYDEKTDALSGINEDILAELGNLSGLTFQSSPLALNETTVEAVQSGRFEVVMGAMLNDKFRQNPALVMSDSFLDSTLAVVTRRGTAFDPASPYVVAMKSAFMVLQDYISSNYPQFTVKFYTTDEECLQAVLNGEAEIVMQNVNVTNYLLQKPQYEALEILPTTFMTESSAFLASSQTDARLISILNKAIKLLKSDRVDRIILANTTAKPYRLSIGDVLYKYRLPLSMVAVLVAVCIVLLIVLLTARQRHVRTLQGKNQQLSDAVLQAERANTAKSQFLSRMSHEIRTPMNAIVGITAIAKQHEREPEKIDDYLSKIDTSSRVLLNIINDVLDMSAIESDKLKIASAEFDIKQVLGGITTIYYPQCKQKGITLEVGVDLNNELLIGDSLRVNQILMNLVSNAYKFTESGGTIRLTVSETGRRDSSVFIRFIVADTGCGMTEDMQARLFKPFEQETATTAQRHGGSGLGMSIAKNLVDMMHGAIAVSSEKGKGTTFTVDIPFGLTNKQPTLTSDKLKDIRALVVDDEKHVREYTGIVLERIGVHYETAASGEEAVRMLMDAHDHGTGYDICFVDWKMPGLTGIDVTRKIRELFDRDTLIIIVSAYDTNEVEEEARQAGADMIVAKPLFQSTVFNVLMQLSGGKFTSMTANESDFDFTGHRVLMAEDNELNAEIAIELLDMVHMQVDRAKDGEEAVAMFGKSLPGTYDAVLMDVQMPKLDGYGATRAIRAGNHPQAKSVPIYAMTANAFNEDVSAALSCGMNGHIAKPIDTQILYSTLKKCIFGDHE